MKTEWANLSILDDHVTSISETRPNFEMTQCVHGTVCVAIWINVLFIMIKYPISQVSSIFIEKNIFGADIKCVPTSYLNKNVFPIFFVVGPFLSLAHTHTHTAHVSM